MINYEKSFPANNQHANIVVIFVFQNILSAF